MHVDSAPANTTVRPKLAVTNANERLANTLSAGRRFRIAGRLSSAQRPMSTIQSTVQRQSWNTQADRLTARTLDDYHGHAKITYQCQTRYQGSRCGDNAEGFRKEQTR